MQYYKRLRVRRVAWTLFPAMILWLAAAALLLCFGPAALRVAFPVSLKSLPFWKLEGAYVEYDVPYIYTCYEREMAAPEDGGGAVGAFYLIDVQHGVNDYFFMGLYACGDLLAPAETLYAESRETGEPEALRVRGTVMALEGDELERYEEAARRAAEALSEGEDAAVEAELLTHVKPLCLNAGMAAPWTKAQLRHGLLLAAALLLLGLAPLIRGLCTGALTGRDLRQIREKFEELGGGEALAEDIAEFYNATPPIGGVRVGRDFILLPGPKLLRPWDVAWAYYRESRKGPCCVLRTMDGESCELRMRGKKVWELLETLHERCPGILVGYTEEIERYYEENRAIFVTSWENERPGCIRHGY